MLDPGQELPVIDEAVDVMAGCDVLTPLAFFAMPGTALEFTPPAGRSATDVARHLRKNGVQLGWPVPILSPAPGVFVLKVPDKEAAKAEGILRRMK